MSCGKRQHVERSVNRALLRYGVPAIDVHDIRDRVKGEEGDADRQQHPRNHDRIDLQCHQQRVEVVGGEIGVFEHTEHEQVGPDRKGQQPSCRPRSPEGLRHGTSFGLWLPRRCGRFSCSCGAGLQTRDRDRDPIVEGNRPQHQPGERPAALRVEHEARQEQQPVAVRAVNS